MSQARKNLELHMKVTADAHGASEALKGVTREAERAGHAVRNIGGMAGSDQGGMAGGGGGGSGGGKGVKSPMEGLKELGAWVAVGTGFVATATNLSKAVMDLDSSFMTVREKTLGFAAALPVVGDSIARFMGSIMDARDRMLNPEAYKDVQRMREENPVRMAQREARHEYAMRRSALEGEVEGAGFNLQATREFPTISAEQSLLRMGMGGMAGAFYNASLDAIDPRIASALEGIQSAKRGHRMAELQAGSSGADVDTARAKAAAAMRQFRALKGRAEGSYDAARGVGGPTKTGGGRTLGMGLFGGGASALVLGGGTGGGVAGMLSTAGSNLEMQQNELKLQDAAHAAALANAELEAKITDHKRNQLALARQAHEVAKAETGVMKAQVDLIREKERESRMGQRQLGGMDAIDRWGMLQSLQRFKEGGRENVTSSEFAMLQGNALTREFVGKRSEEDASNDPVVKKIMELAGVRNAEDLKKEGDKLQAEVQMKIQFDEVKFAEVMQKSLEKLNLKDLLGELIKNQLEIKLAAPEGGVRRMHAGLGGG